MAPTFVLTLFIGIDAPLFQAMSADFWRPGRSAQSVLSKSRACLWLGS
jgi:hypothetical protein